MAVRVCESRGMPTTLGPKLRTARRAVVLLTEMAALLNARVTLHCVAVETRNATSGPYYGRIPNTNIYEFFRAILDSKPRRAQKIIPLGRARILCYLHLRFHGI